MAFYNKGALEIVKKELSTMALKLITKFSSEHKLDTNSEPVVKYMDFAKQLIAEEVKAYRTKYCLIFMFLE